MRKAFAFCFMSILLFSFYGTNLFAASMEKPVYENEDSVKPLGVGEMVPDGYLNPIKGKQVKLKTLISKKPTILLFYRGGWCPYCNAHLGRMTKVAPELEDMGYQIVAITPDKPESLKETMFKNRISYTLLSDQKMEITRKFGLAYKVNEVTLSNMKKWGEDLEKTTGNKLHLLPVPAAYIVDTKGVIRFAYYNSDFHIRVNTDDLLEAARKANEK